LRIDADVVFPSESAVRVVHVDAGGVRGGHVQKGDGDEEEEEQPARFHRRCA
jgi:hypothetical protein